MGSMHASLLAPAQAAKSLAPASRRDLRASSIAMISSLTAENLACVRGERRVFADLNFRCGGRGAGGGRRQWRGQDFAAAPDRGLSVARRRPRPDQAGDGAKATTREERGRLVGWLGHQDGLKPQMTVKRAAANSLRSSMRARRCATARPLDRVGLARQRRASLPLSLSAGQKRRLALARLLLSRRRLWLLDEPFAALDTSGQALVANVMARHCAEGGIIIAATHDPLGLAQ